MTNYHHTAISLGMFLILFGLSGITCRSESQDIEIVPEPLAEEPPCCDDDPALVPPFDYAWTDAERLLASQSCAHESTWAGGVRTYDCAA